MDAEDGDAGIKAVAARVGRGNARAAREIWPNRISPRAQPERDSRRIARLQRSLLAGADFVHEHAARLAPGKFAAGASTQATGRSIRVSDGGALLPALPTWPRPQLS